MRIKQYLLWDISFAGWFIAEVMAAHSKLSVVALLLFCIMPLLYSFIYKQLAFRPVAVFLCYFLLIVVCVINLKCGYSIAPNISMSLVQTLLKNVLFLICVGIYISNRGSEHVKDVLLNTATAASGLLLAYTLICWGSLRLRESGSVNPNVLAICDAVSILLLVVDKDKEREKRYLQIAILTLFCLLAGTRKAILGLICGLAIYSFLSAQQKASIKIIRIFGILTVTYFLLMEIPILYELIGSRFESLFLMASGEVGDGSSEVRRYFIELGWQHFLKRPLTGNGVDCFRVLPGAYGTYSHCNYIELLFGVGMIGLIIYYLPHIIILWKSVKSVIKKQQQQNSIIAISIIIMLLLFDVALVSYYSRPCLLLLVFCAYISKPEMDRPIWRRQKCY